MANTVEICNLALGNIRANSINSLTESSLEAQVCQQRFTLALEFMLREHPWRFARKTRGLSLLGDTPKEWQYAYDYPSDCIRALYVLPNINTASERTSLYHFEDWEIDQRQNERPAWEMALGSDGGRVILTDQSEAYLVYVSNDFEVAQLDPTFVDALSWYLSAQLALPIVGAETGRALRSESLSIYQEVLSAAKARDANENYGISRAPESPTIVARRT